MDVATTRKRDAAAADLATNISASATIALRGNGQNGHAQHDAHIAKALRVANDRVAPVPSGANLIEVDGKSCTHEVVWPEGQQGDIRPPPARPGPPAKEYPFQIDPFQQTAINCLEAGHSVLVAAHTSAGKTVVAEYAFAMALRDKQRVVYTSPLKALSNQKYRELYEEFQDVGLMTGDVTINPNASCLVMTTEILRSMLYRGSEVVREVQLVVYDEIHYLRDKERGVVWEESIVLAPTTCRFAFLSATIPNAAEFAQWIAKVHKSPCHVVYTEYRPTPLEHYVFPAGGEGLYCVVDQRGTFRDDSFQKAVAVMQADAPGGGPGGGRGKKGKEVKNTGQGERSDIYRVVRMIMERNYDPVIVFSFSKRECEALALQMSGLDLNSEDEKKMVDGIYWAALDCLSEDDKRLPQLTNMLPMLKRGIGVHHSGLLPILKEVIELLFQDGLIKVLFATETFSTGLNMPAKTVVFTNARKFDGGGFRWISSGEYIQMSGRAGRRGLDDKGIVILMLDTKMEPGVAKSMVKGAADNLYSEFHLTYSMLLNLMRADGALEPEALMAASYRQFQMERALPQLEARAQALQEEHDALDVADESSVSQYLLLRQQLREHQAALRRQLTSPKVALPFLQPGRLVRVATKEDGTQGEPSVCPSAATLDLQQYDAPGVWGVIINFERLGGGGKASAADEDGTGDSSSKKKKKSKKAGGGGGASYIVDVLLCCAADSVAARAGGQAGGSLAAAGGKGQPPRFVRPGAAAAQAGPGPTAAAAVPLVVALPLGQIDRLSSVRIYIPQDLRQQESRALATKALAEVCSRFPDGVPLLDMEDDLKLKDDKARKLLRKVEAAESSLDRHPMTGADDLRPRLQALQRKQELAEQARLARREAKAAASLVMKDELKARRRVLLRLGYVTEEGVVTLKGRAAAELATGDELVLCEMLFGGAFKGLNSEQLAALCSCFVWRERSEAGNKVREDLEGVYSALREAARRVARVAAECRLPGVDVDEYVSSFRPDLMDAAAAWARGERFADVLKISAVFEGSLVRAVRREEELLRQLAAAAKAVGDVEQAAAFEELITRMKRDIIFAASLYL